MATELENMVKIAKVKGLVSGLKIIVKEKDEKIQTETDELKKVFLESQKGTYELVIDMLEDCLRD